MFRYAQINLETGRVESDSFLASEVVAENLIPVAEDFALDGKKYINGEWVQAEVADEKPVVVQEETQLDRIESLLAKSHAEIAQAAVDAYTLELIEGGVI